MSFNSTAPVAVMDSGVGGIGVLREVRKLLPCENLYYFGDSANAPYGERDVRELCELICVHAERLLSFSKALVLACNTATAVAAARLRRRYPKTPIVGIEPALRPAVAICPHPTVVILATETTLREEKFARLCRRYGKNARLFPLAAPKLVRLVEAGRGNTPEADQCLAELLAPLGGLTPDAVVLGCTHFPFAAPAIRRVLGEKIPLFDGAAGVARQLVRLLDEARLKSPLKEIGDVRFESSDPNSLSRYIRFFQAT